MTLGGFLLLLLVAVAIGVIAEAMAGARAGLAWIVTIIVGLLGAWIGSALFRVGPLIGGVYLISSVLGAIVLVLLLKIVTARRTV